ncbi:LuxR family two component transcriptional regulator [Humibacillus xanthopallidus]|uniref:LuxR family two component transcriptional regulator n=1 Tax=Humibacillus xanthopallidus TaxID=412689 RepID=A0A543PPS1_9MICO|nr:response regulator transcription factor [Humibacillus xanthopallidus]TQN46058.1 LuxR family two component transcriptional regulator [Humibacillus xanthopallidus]
MRLVVCDDHRLLLEALAVSLRARGHDVVDLCTTPEAGLEAVTRHQPDVCLLDLHFPEGTSLQALRAMVARCPDTRVVVFSAAADPQAVSGALALGAAGYLLKSMSMEEICEMLDHAARGQVAVEPGLLRQAFLPPSAQDPLWVLRFLTDREWDALRCITRGMSTDQIARQLGVRRSTARTHVQNLLHKLGVHSRLEAAALMADHAAEEDWPARLRS